MPEEKKPLTIVVGTNALTDVQYSSYTNHCQFWFRLGRSYPHRFIFSCPPRMSIDRMRNMTAKCALQTNADYILFLDDDVIVPPNNGLEMLLACDADIAAGRVCVRGYPFDYMTFHKTEADPEGLYIAKKLPESGMHSCDAVGFSFALIKVDLIRKMKEPWFVTGTANTEDIYFCKRARAIDPDCKIVTNCDCNCGHILWPEIISETNRDAYKRYLEELTPALLNTAKPNGKDRGVDYLQMVIATIGEQQNAQA